MSFTYDDNGNLESDGSTDYTYDIENRLTSAKNTATQAVIATLKYDPLGRLYETSSPGGATTRFLYDGDALVAEYDTSGTITKRYVHGSGVDEPLLEYGGSTVGQANRSNLYADYLGSITAITDDSGAVITINQYDSYGIPDALNSGRFQYTGQILIPELGLYHYKARIYSPYIGRFLQTDPVGYEDQMNLYAYVGNDPLSNVDPSGGCSRAALSIALGTSLADGPLPVGEAIGIGITLADCGYRVYKIIEAVRAPVFVEDVGDMDRHEEEEDEDENENENEYWEDEFPDEIDRKKNRERRNKERSEKPKDPVERELRKRENEDSKRRTGRGGDDPAPDVEY